MNMRHLLYKIAHLTHPNGPLLPETAGTKMWANEIIRRANRTPGARLTPMKLQKVLYVLETQHRASTGNRLLDGQWEAWQTGPTNRHLYGLTRARNQAKPIRRLMPLASNHYPILDTSTWPGAQTSELIDSVWEQAKRLTAGQIANSLIKGEAFLTAWRAKELLMDESLIAQDEALTLVREYMEGRAA